MAVLKLISEKMRRMSSVNLVEQKKSGSINSHHIAEFIITEKNSRC